MDKKTLIKYLEFLKNECLRHQNDKHITDDEMNQLKVEINKFIERLEVSSLDDTIKTNVLNIDINLNEHNHNKRKLNWLFGGYQAKEIKEQENRKHRLSKLYDDIDHNLFKIKSIL